MDNETKDIQKAEVKPQPLVSIDDGDFQCFLDTAKFNQMYRAAQVFAASQIVPAQYRDKPNDCFIALQMAMRSKCDPLAFIQGTYVVYGRPGMEAKLAIALINTRGPFEGPIRWKFEGTGQNRKCTAYAKHRKTGEMCEATVSWEMAEKEGWTRKNGSKWQTMPDLMFQYRSATFLGRLYCPEVLFGMQTVEEIVDVGPKQVESAVIDAPPAKLGVDGLKEKIEAAKLNGAAIPPAETPKKQSRPAKTEQPKQETVEQKEYICPACGAQWTAKEVKQKSDGTLVCDDCMGLVCKNPAYNAPAENKKPQWNCGNCKKQIPASELKEEDGILIHTKCGSPDVFDASIGA